MKKPWRARLRDYRLKREKDQPLDEAIYMSVVTGRLEPLLRASQSIRFIAAGKSYTPTMPSFYSPTLPACEQTIPPR